VPQYERELSKEGLATAGDIHEPQINLIERNQLSIKLDTIEYLTKAL